MTDISPGFCIRSRQAVSGNASRILPKQAAEKQPHFHRQIRVLYYLSHSVYIMAILAAISLLNVMCQPLSIKKSRYSLADH